MRRRVVLATLLLGGCDLALGLRDREPPPVDAACVLPDEDADCVADAVDNCPGAANADQADLLEGSADGVGDACDPNPTRGGDRLVFFDGFADPARSAVDWNDPSINGKWRLVDGEANHSESTDNFALLQRTVPISGAEVTLEAGFTFVAWGPTANGPRLGLFVDSEVDMTSGHACWLAPEDGQLPGQDEAWMQEGAIGTTSLAGIDPLVFDDVITLRLTRVMSPAQIACAVTPSHGATPLLVPLTPSGPWPVDRHVGISAANTAVTLRYAAIYAVP